MTAVGARSCQTGSLRLYPQLIAKLLDFPGQCGGGFWIRIGPSHQGPVLCLLSGKVGSESGGFIEKLLVGWIRGRVRGVSRVSSPHAVPPVWSAPGQNLGSDKPKGDQNRQVEKPVCLGQQPVGISGKSECDYDRNFGFQAVHYSPPEPSEQL